MENEINVLLSSKTTGACEWLMLPATEEELIDVLTIIGARSADDLEIDDLKCDMPCVSYSEYADTDVNELNYLANLIDTMHDYQLHDFCKLAEYMGEYDHSCVTIEDLINCVFTIDNAIILNGVSDYYDLGKYYIEECDGIDDDYLRDKLGFIADYVSIDYEKYGEAYYNDAYGGFVDDDWVELPEGFSEEYDGTPDDIPSGYNILDPDWEPENDNGDEYINEKALKIDELLLM